MSAHSRRFQTQRIPEQFVPQPAALSLSDSGELKVSTQRTVHITQGRRSELSVGEEMLTVRDGDLDALVIEVTVALLTHLGCPVRPLAPREGVMQSVNDALAAVIGYVGPGFEGALTMMTTPELLAKTVPSSVQDTSQAPHVLQDWSAEVANQLLGRLKNKLALRDLSFRVAPPIPMFAQCLTIPPLRRPNATTWFEFATPHGPLSVRFELLAHAGWALPSLVPTVEPLMQEGDLELF